MFYVYLIKSLSHPEQKYIGITQDLKKRIAEHDGGAIEAYREIYAMGVGYIPRLSRQIQSV